MQAPVWIELGTHIGTTSHSDQPTNVPDGFFYVPLLDTLIYICLVIERFFNRYMHETYPCYVEKVNIIKLGYIRLPLIKW